MGHTHIHTGTVHPPQTTSVTHPNSIKNRSYFLLSTTRFTCPLPPLLTDAILPVPALATGNMFKLCCPTVSIMWGQGPCSHPFFTAVLSSPSRVLGVHLPGLEGESWGLWGKVTFPLEINSSHVSLFTFWSICHEPFFPEV